MFTKTIGHVGHFKWLGPNVWWEISQNWIEYIKPIGQFKCLMNHESFSVTLICWDIPDIHQPANIFMIIAWQMLRCQALKDARTSAATMVGDCMGYSVTTGREGSLCSIQDKLKGCQSVFFFFFFIWRISLFTGIGLLSTEGGSACWVHDIGSVSLVVGTSLK